MPRDRSVSYSPRRSSSPRRAPPRRGDAGSDTRTSLLVRNLPRDARPDDLRGPFERYGPIKDVYLPKDYHTGEPRGFGFVQFVDPEDAQEAAYYVDGKVIGGRQVTVVFAEESRKKPTDMRARERQSRSRYSSHGYERRRSPPSRRFSPPRARYSRSPPPRSRYPRSRSPGYGGRGGGRSKSPLYASPPRRQGGGPPLSPADSGRMDGDGNGATFDDEY